MSRRTRDADVLTSGARLLPILKSAAGKRLVKARGALESAIFNSANFSSIATDAKGVIQIFNVGAERMLGYAACDVLNRFTPADMSDPQELLTRAAALSSEVRKPIAPGFEALVYKAARGIEDIYELTYIRKDGSRFPAIVSVTALRDADGAIIGYLLIGTDNTARKRAEEALLKAGALQNAIFNSAHFSSIATDANGIIQIFNVGAERMLGYAAGDVLNKFTPADMSDPQELLTRAAAMSRELEKPIAPGFEALVYKAARGIEDIYELTYVRKDGSRLPAIVSVTALRDAEAIIIGYLLIATDNTARKRAMEKFRLALEAAPTGMLMMNGAGTIVLVNAQIEALFGYRRDELLGQSLEMLVPERFRAHHPGLRKGFFGDPKARVMGAGRELYGLRKDGTEVPIEIGLNPVETSEGRCVIGSIADITARKNAERQLYATASLLRTVLDSASGISIIATNPSLTIKVFNAGAERLLGYTSDEIVGRATPLRLHDPEEVRVCAEELSAQLGRPIEGGQIFQTPSMHGRAREWTYVRKDGARVVVALAVTPMQTYEGELLGYVSVARDISQQKQYEESLRRATQNAETASSAKSLFLANMSHEIRTPMTAVTGLTYLLEQTSLSADQAELLARINVASKALLAVVNDVLDISKIEAGELTISREAFSPGELLTGLHAIMRVQADLKGITLELDLPDELPAALEGDAARLNQILTNLISNAIKFTERGGVTLRMRSLGSSPTGTRLSFTVRDTGIGINPEAQARLFAPFIQADNSITRRFGGTGLGLSIISSLTKLLGGTVDFTSEVGVGSEFRVVLEFALATTESLAATQSRTVSPGERPLAGMQVLVVDDYDLNLVVTKRILERAGALVWVAQSGQEACEKLQRQPVDIVLMDVQMPVMDGYEAARRIRANLGLVDLPIIAVTAGALSSERQRATAAGMNDLVIKPFDPATLTASVFQHTVRPHVAALNAQSLTTTAMGARAWPEIEGIDREIARNRLSDDPVLFRTLLERFIGDFSDIAPLASSFADQASRFHQLRGGACVLGATAIQHLALLAEAACVAGDAVGAQERSIELVAHLRKLRSSAVSAFEAVPPGEDPMAA